MTDREELAAIVKQAVITHDFYAEPAADRIIEWVTARDVRRDAEVAAKALEDAAGRLREMDEPWGVKLYGAFSAWLKGRSAALRASSLGAENPEMTGDES